MSTDDVARAIERTDELMLSLTRLRGPEAVTSLRESVRSDRAATIHLLMHVEPDVVEQLIPEIVDVAFHHGLALVAREVLGRLHRDVLRARLPAVVHDAAIGEDDDGLRRLAELLQHVGLREELAAFVEPFRTSPDPHIRAILADFVERP